MLAGEPPFDESFKKLQADAEPPDLGALRPTLPVGVVRAILTALSWNPDKRFPSASRFREALEQAVPLSGAMGDRSHGRVDSFTTTLTAVAKTQPVEAETLPQPADRGEAGFPGGQKRGKGRWILLAAAMVLLLISLGSADWISDFAHQKTSSKNSTEAPVSANSEKGSRLANLAPVSLQADAGEDKGAPSLPAKERREQVKASPSPDPGVVSRNEEPKLEDSVPPLTSGREPEGASIPEPAPIQGAPEPASPGSVEIDQFKEMEAYVVKIANLSEKVFEAYEEEGREDELYNRLEAFHEAAVGTRREFRKATGTGILDTVSKVRGKSGDTRQLEIKVNDLSRKAGEVDSLIGGSSATIQEYWREIKSNLGKLKGYF